MTGHPTEDEVQARLDGALGEDAVRSLDDHLETCPECAARFADLIAVDRWLRVELTPAATPRRPRRVRRVAAAALIGAAVIALGWTLRSRNEDPEVREGGPSEVGSPGGEGVVGVLLAYEARETVRTAAGEVERRWSLDADGSWRRHEIRRQGEMTIETEDRGGATR
ncbi:MAG: zf-HC2 domain-containing protein [Planctomycetota bacterium]